MFSLARLPTLLFDPRGRADRSDMLVSAGIVLAIEGALALIGPAEGFEAATWCAKACSLWIGIAAIAKRLRDLGRSAWLMTAACGALCIWTAGLTFVFLLVLGPSSLQQGSLGMTVLLGLVMLPAIGAALWLHLAAGVTEPNRSGRAEGGSAPALDPAQAAGA